MLPQSTLFPYKTLSTSDSDKSPTNSNRLKQLFSTDWNNLFNIQKPSWQHIRGTDLREQGKRKSRPEIGN